MTSTLVNFASRSIVAQPATTASTQAAVPTKTTSQSANASLASRAKSAKPKLNWRKMTLLIILSKKVL